MHSKVDRKLYTNLNIRNMSLAKIYTLKGRGEVIENAKIPLSFFANMMKYYLTKCQ